MRLTAILMATALTMGLSVPAAATTFGDRAGFNGATSARTTIAFNGVADGDAVLAGSSYVSGGTTFADGIVYNVGRTAGGFAAGVAYGSGYLEWQGSAPEQLTITLSQAVTAIGFDFMELRGYNAPFTVSAGGATYSLQTGASAGFFGLTSASGFSTVTLTMPSMLADAAATHVYPTIDNFTFGTASPALATTLVATAVPEPASWAMMTIGFGLIGGGLRRQRRARTGLAIA